MLSHRLCNYFNIEVFSQTTSQLCTIKQVSKHFLWRIDAVFTGFISFVFIEIV